MARLSLVGVTRIELKEAAGRFNEKSILNSAVTMACNRFWALENAAVRAVGPYSYCYF